ncbi:hypothetical protein MRP04_19950 [Dickeya dianthicola]|uniref:hypothetical protein n=1 Tax=Dickeya dianthicola TaxID=204039 RepID=UPI001F603EF4|nr:hypothetical protein [Dickeya dianthicola]MCI4032743.1 hypothetical protein [Dickeya dianthicola]MCI4172277.1 hypothetical protein [Dickeya dianthicola]MCI4177419.1 hypothetical protein [Dickeya dianthicola]MCI4183875.1 hypothetical protein [Dickeya dianthicola]MCI4195660.1 hypothetical protein [Dickeya dianthicola]
MSKFTELCKGYEDFRNEFGKVRVDMYGFSSKLVGHYLNYLGISFESNAEYRLIPLEGVVKEDTNYAPAGATHLGDDGYWHLGFLLTIYISKNTYPQQKIKIHFKFLKDYEGKYILLVDELNCKAVINNVDDLNEFIPVFDGVQDGILRFNLSGIDFLYGKNVKMSSIGFIQDGFFSENE